jgi:hypothetical protein
VNVFTESLPSNERLFSLHYSGFLASEYYLLLLEVGTSLSADYFTALSVAEGVQRRIVDRLGSNELEKKRSGKLPLALVSTVILGSECRRTHNHISVSHESGSRTHFPP